MAVNVRRAFDGWLMLACELGRPADGARGWYDLIWVLEYERGTEWSLRVDNGAGGGRNADLGVACKQTFYICPRILLLKL